jgi:hypothetical protein
LILVVLSVFALFPGLCCLPLPYGRLTLTLVALSVLVLFGVFFFVFI